MIKIEKLHKSYPIGKDSLHVLKGIDLHIKEGEFVSIMGSSGSGKSTLLNIVGLLDVHDEGNYYLNGQVIKDMNEKKAAILRNKFLGFVFQSFNLISYKTALENVALPLYYKGINRKERLEIALEYLEKVGLKDWANHLPNELSGGQKQRVAIARALVTKPKVVLADEPTGALDSTTTDSVMDLLKAINDEGMTVFVITHEEEVAEQTKRIVRLKDGVIISDELTKASKAVTKTNANNVILGGIATNIGVHFYDMLSWIFGSVKKNIVHVQSHDRSSGYLEFDRARVRWFLSINYDVLPEEIKLKGQRTYRSITIEGEELEFSGGFTDLHTKVYKGVLNGKGYGLEDARQAIEIVHDIRNAEPIGLKGDYHPFARKQLGNHPFSSLKQK